MAKPLPPTLLLIAILLSLALHLGFPLALLLRFPSNLLGLAPLAVGAAVNLVADRQFKLARTPVKPGQPPTALVTGGLFRWTRNPMYLGQLLMMAGIALLEGTLGPWGVVAAHAALLHWGYVLPEERALQAAFGPSFEGYRERVRRWL
jgi:protein-S-isoprenylcysteine O-methyltransferase Ste14